MEVFSASGEGLWQELAALAFVSVAALYMIRKLTGWPRPRRKAPPEQTPDKVKIGGKLARGLAKARKR